MKHAKSIGERTRMKSDLTALMVQLQKSGLPRKKARAGTLPPLRSLLGTCLSTVLSTLFAKIQRT